MRSTIAALGCLAAVTLGPLAVPATGALADNSDTSAALTQLTGFHQIVVDSAGNFIFFSEGISSIALLSGASKSSGIVVTNLAGRYIATLDGSDGVEGLALSSDGTKLYAALAATDQVAAINVGSISTKPAQTLYDLPSGDVPYSVAPQSGKIWVSYDTGDAGSGAIGDIDPTTTTFEPVATPSSSWDSAPELEADPGDSNVLAAVQPGLTPASAATFSTATDPAKALAAKGPVGSGSSACSAEYQLAIVPGGSHFVAGCKTPQAAYLYDTSDLLSGNGTHYSGTGAGSPNAVAISAKAMVAAGFSSAGPSVIDTYKADGSRLDALNLPAGVTLASGGLAWSADGTELFAVTKNNTTGAYSLATFALNKATITLRGPGVVTFGADVTIAGKLALTTGAPPAGTGLTVVRTQAGSHATRKFSVATGAGGGFTVTDPHPAKARYTYTVSYAGNATTTPAKAALGVTVARTVPSLAIATSAADETYGKRVTVTATLGPTFADRTVSIYVRPAGQAQTRLKTGRVSTRGVLTVSYRMSRNAAFTAVFAGDAHNAPRTAVRGVGAWVQVYMSNGGYFKTVVIDRVRYRVYHHTGHLTASALIVPDKAGECVDLEVQQHASDVGWFANHTFGCLSLNRLSKIATSIGLAKAAGAQYRMRADYLHGKDAANLSTDGSWFYFEVVS